MVALLLALPQRQNGMKEIDVVFEISTLIE